MQRPRRAPCQAAQAVRAALTHDLSERLDHDRLVRAGHDAVAAPDTQVHRHLKPLPLALRSVTRRTPPQGRDRCRRGHAPEVEGHLGRACTPPASALPRGQGRLGAEGARPRAAQIPGLGRAHAPARSGVNAPLRAPVSAHVRGDRPAQAASQPRRTRRGTAPLTRAGRRRPKSLSQGTEFKTMGFPAGAGVGLTMPLRKLTVNHYIRDLNRLSTSDALESVQEKLDVSTSPSRPASRPQVADQLQRAARDPSSKAPARARASPRVAGSRPPRPVPEPVARYAGSPHRARPGAARCSVAAADG